MTTNQHNAFINAVLEHFNEHERDLAWRRPDVNGVFNPYFILVSEIMLQQTQVKRVAIKYNQFIQTFPNVARLADADLSEVLAQWSGLGYNRRAKFLHQAAKMICSDFVGEIPKEITDAVRLPGVGYNTAAAVLTYAYNQKHAYIETNIRSVYMYHFFINQDLVNDKDILKVVDKTLDHIEQHDLDFRTWYWALMDYGTFLKSQGLANNAKSKHYKKQSKFEGSKRQIRGKVVKLLLPGPHDIDYVLGALQDERSQQVIDDLQREGIVILEDSVLRLG